MNDENIGLADGYLWDVAHKAIMNSLPIPQGIYPSIVIFKDRESCLAFCLDIKNEGFVKDTSIIAYLLIHTIKSKGISTAEQKVYVWKNRYVGTNLIPLDIQMYPDFYYE